MAAQKIDKQSVMASTMQTSRQAAVDWLKNNGEHALFAVGTIFMWSAAAHAAYLAVVPEPLRVSVAKRNQRIWKGLALGSLAGVALYDSVHNALLAEQQQQLTAEAKHLRTKLHTHSSSVTI